ncbi:MAG: methyltransferase domain-containing protein [Desulfobacteraceae bacterium]|nr:methyltransferase domain-containing protein [Desulfobacteraceae bacterium]
MKKYIYRPTQKLTYETAVRVLEKQGTHKIVKGAIDNTSPSVVKNILDQAQDLGIQDLAVDIAAYERYVAKAGYADRYPGYYAGNLFEKSLEHFVAFQLLDIRPEEVFIDLASEHSPVPDIFSRLTGARAYGQDIMYPAGIHGSRIGGDACSMPVPDGFAHKAALTCSLEHFEQDADTRLFSELARVLRPGGRVVVVPFYLFTEPAVQTDPAVSVPASVAFDRDAAVFCAQGWGNRHGRFYSPTSFQQRITAPLAGKFRFDVVHLVNAHEVDASVYARFAFVAQRV